MSMKKRIFREHLCIHRFSTEWWSRLMEVLKDSHCEKGIVPTN
jgi:hypothetical protein